MEMSHRSQVFQNIIDEAEADLRDLLNIPDNYKVLFLQELLNTTRSFAPSLFDGNEGRMKVLDAVQDAVDNAIAEEDAWLASQE